MHQLTPCWPKSRLLIHCPWVRICYHGLATSVQNRRPFLSTSSQLESDAYLLTMVLTDIDMPRMDGIELVTLIKKAPNLQSLPVMIVSYKDREEDRRRGLDAGADYYLAKGSFDDAALLQVVTDLIGEAQA